MENPFEMSSHSLDETDDAEEAHLQFLTRQLVQPSPLQPPNHDHLSSKTPVNTTSATSITSSLTSASSSNTLSTSQTSTTTASDKDASQTTKVTTISNSNHIFSASSIR